MNNDIYFKISRKQMNKSLTILNDAYNKLKNEIKEYEEKNKIKVDELDEVIYPTKLKYGIDLKKKREKLKEYLEVANFSIKQTKLKSFYIDYDFAKLIKSVLFIEEKEAK